MNGFVDRAVGKMQNARMPDWTALDLEHRADGVAVLTMNRPAVFNAFDEVLIAELDAACATLGADPAVRVVVLAGAGKHYSAGADVQWMQRA
ncbi:enoyl-CoA hydratase-related protein, partial [Acinetobacter baumannii]